LHDVAAIFGDGSSATAGGGDYNLAAVFGDGSTAFAGLGNNGLAVVFGDLLSAYAPQGATDIEPSLDFLDGSSLTGMLRPGSADPFSPRSGCEPELTVSRSTGASSVLFCRAVAG
jgi:hypothetical protein